MMNIADNKKFCDSPTTDNIFYEKNKCVTDIGMDYVKSNGDLTIVNNNNTIKSERLSPTSHQNGSSGAPGDPVPLINSSRYSIEFVLLAIGFTFNRAYEFDMTLYVPVQTYYDNIIQTTTSERYIFI